MIIANYYYLRSLSKAKVFLSVITFCLTGSSFLIISSLKLANPKLCLSIALASSSIMGFGIALLTQ